MASARTVDLGADVAGVAGARAEDAPDAGVVEADAAATDAAGESDDGAPGEMGSGEGARGIALAVAAPAAVSGAGAGAGGGAAAPGVDPMDSPALDVCGAPGPAGGFAGDMGDAGDAGDAGDMGDPGDPGTPGESGEAGPLDL